MRIAVIDSAFADQRFQGLAASWLRWELPRMGVAVTSVEDCDVVFITSNSQQGIDRVRIEAKRARKLGKKVVLGGECSFGPSIFIEHVDAVCVGEGYEFIEHVAVNGIGDIADLPYVYTGGSAEIIPSTIYPWHHPPIMHPDGYVRIPSSRGCKRRCMFCQTGWQESYQKNPNMDNALMQARKLSDASVGYTWLTNDAIVDGVADDCEHISATADAVFRNRILRSNTKKVRIGVEGISSRLRRAVRKPIDISRLIDSCIDMMNRGIGVGWFFVIGLPGENDDDWREHREAISEIKAKAKKGVIMATYHAYIPQPATPLSVLPLEDGYWDRFESFRRWFFDGPGHTRHYRIMPPAREPGRMTRAQQSINCSEAELRRGWWEHDQPNWVVRTLAGPPLLRRLAARYVLEMNTVAPVDIS